MNQKRNLKVIENFQNCFLGILAECENRGKVMTTIANEHLNHVSVWNSGFETSDRKTLFLTVVKF